MAKVYDAWASNESSWQWREERERRERERRRVCVLVCVCGKIATRTRQDVEMC